MINALPLLLILPLLAIAYKNLSRPMDASILCQEEGKVFYDLRDKCGSYYVCEMNSSNSFNLVHHQCPEDQAFNVPELSCDPSVFCNGAKDNTLCSSCTSVCPDGPGRYFINSSCARFWDCDPVLLKPRVLMCDHSQYYDRDEEQCVHGKCSYNLTDFDRDICKDGEGSYPDFSSCIFYWYCSEPGGSPEERVCGHKEYFDRNSEECQAGTCPYSVHEVELLEWSYLDVYPGWKSVHQLSSKSRTGYENEVQQSMPNKVRRDEQSQLTSFKLSDFIM